MEYKYKGINGEGKIVKGTIYHENQWGAISKLSKEGISCIRCEGESERSEEISTGTISYKDIVLLSRTLKNNLKSGIPIITSLKLIADHIKRKNLALTLRKMFFYIERGETLTEALNKCGGTFPHMFISMVSIGEESGKLEEVFASLEVYFAREEKRRKAMVNVTIYPMVIFMASAIGAFIIITKFMPTFFNNAGVEKSQVPAITKFYMTIADVFLKLDYLLIPIILIFMGTLIFLYKRLEQHDYLDKLKYTSVITKGIFINNFRCRFTMSLHMIITCGIDIKSAFNLLEKSEISAFIKKRYYRGMEELEKGVVLSQVIRNFNLFSEEFLVSIFLGEESGDLEQVLLRYNEIFEEELKNKMDLMIKLLEPGLIILAGLFLLSIYAAILLPIYGIYS